MIFPESRGNEMGWSGGGWETWPAAHICHHSNIFVARLTENVNDDLDIDTGGKNWMWERGYLNAAPQKADEILQFHVGDMVTSLIKTELTPGGQEVSILCEMAKRNDEDRAEIKRAE